MKHQQKNTEVANTTLSRLIAGDFLESLGKELGLEVPPELSHSEHKFKDPATQKETVDANKGENNSNSTLLVERKLSSTTSAVGNGSKTQQEVPQGNPYHPEVSPDGGSRVLIENNTQRSGSQRRGTDSFDNNSVKNKLEKASQEHKKANTSTGRRDWSSSSSEDERGIKRSRRHRHKNSYSDADTTDSSDDYRDRHRSRSKGRTKGSSREKSSSRKHSKHHKHRSGHSPNSSSRHGSRKDHGEAKREKRKYKD